MNVAVVAQHLAARGVAFAPAIARAAARHGVDPDLLAGVAAQETGGPGSNAGRNVVGDGGHGHGVFQIDDRWHAFAGTPQAMNPERNADYAAGMLSGLLRQYGGNVHEALSAYNAGAPNRTGTLTTWSDGQTLGYADSVERHAARIAGRNPSPIAENGLPSGAPLGGAYGEEALAQLADEIASLGTLMNAAQQMPMAPPTLPPPAQPQPYRPSETDYSSLFDDAND